MLNLKSIKKTVVTLAIGFALVFCPTLTHAKFKDRSDELPGGQSDKELVTSMIIPVALLTALSVSLYLLIKKNKKNQVSETIKESPDVHQDELILKESS